MLHELLRVCLILGCLCLGPLGQALEPIPDKLVVLTFDDSVVSHYSVVRPLLKQYNFSATFFITEGFSFLTNKADYMTWEQKYLHDQGFQVIALRDLARYVDADRAPPEPFAVLQQRQEQRSEIVVRGEVVDDATGQPLPARLYIQGEDGTWHFPHSIQGSAVRYQRRSGFNTNAVEMHTTLSAHPFSLELPPGRYTFTVERGKEYFPETREVTVGQGSPPLKFSLRRWIDMAKVSWYSGDTHVHRDPADLPNVMLAEDVNVVFPMVYWTTDADVSPRQSNRGFQGDFPAAPVTVDATHVYYPRNTEYEIFTTAKRQHTLGALLLINHKTVFDLPALPVTKVAERARAEGALLDLEKHNWPWSMALVPLVRPDLYELANNHLWRTEYGVTNWAVPAPAWMELGTGGTTERAWALYGLLNYYALLDCGFRLRPSAGTANGVHPVPLGFGRVYVHLENGFNYQDWLRGLNQGRSFVTTGPMLFVTVNGRLPGHTFGPASPKERTKHHRVEGTALSAQPLRSIEIVVNGEVVDTLTPANRKTITGSHESLFRKTVKVEESSWVAVRCFEKRPHGRLSFAHTAPFYIDVPGKPLRPRREEVAFLLQRVNEEMARSKEVLSDAALEEYRQAKAAYVEIGKTAR